MPDRLQTAKIPLTLFFPPQNLGDKLQLSTRLRDASGGVLDGEPVILPVPPNGPPDLPRVQLESGDKSFILQISLHRMTLEWNRRTPEPAPWGRLSERFFGICDNLLRVAVGEYFRPTRLALNPQFIIDLGQSANEYLAGYVLHPDRVIRRPRAIRMGVLDNLEVAGRNMNLWLNVSTLRQHNQPGNDNHMVVHFDYNSLAEEAAPLSAEQIIAILRGLDAVMEERIRSFFNDLFWESNS